MNKNSSVTPLNTLLLSALMGGGFYGAGRLMREMTPKQEQASNELNLTLPAARMPKPMANKIGSASDYVAPILAGAVGLPLGFMGTSAIYEALKKRQMDNELKDTQQKYFGQLATVNQKLGEATPLTDAFCDGMMDKVADGGMLNSLAHPISSTLNGVSELVGLGAHGAYDKTKEAITNTPVGRSALSTALLLTLGFGGATYALGRRTDQLKNQAQQNHTLPQTVKINTV